MDVDEPVVANSSSSSSSSSSSDKTPNSFQAWYRELASTQQEVPVHRLFSRSGGEYFTAHGDTALFFADEFFKSRSSVKYYGGSADEVSE
jgi:hypothetical protein